VASFTTAMVRLAVPEASDSARLAALRAALVADFPDPVLGLQLMAGDTLSSMCRMLVQLPLITRLFIER